ncbi:MAG: hypothetical protein HFJ66_07080 [Eggerthellaceae bacterium]|nr:hypothetical protein [Eggerthellaceae bacterium]
MAASDQPAAAPGSAAPPTSSWQSAAPSPSSRPSASPPSSSRPSEASGEIFATPETLSESGKISPLRPSASGRDDETPCHPERSAERGVEGSPQPPVVIAHLYPDLLNLYGDGGNVRILQERLAWRGIPVEVRRVEYGDAAHLADADLVFMGGGPDREQKLASEELLAMRDELAQYVEADGPVLAICGGYQILGHRWLWGDELVEGLSIVDLETRRPGTSADRLVDNLVLQSPLAETPVVSYENHAGRTYLGPGVQPFGRVISETGSGNNEQDKADGVLYRNVVGTYSHGPLLSKNPEVADWLLARALERRQERTDTPAPALSPLDDSQELQANAVMRERLGL